MHEREGEGVRERERNEDEEWEILGVSEWIGVKGKRMENNGRR